MPDLLDRLRRWCDESGFTWEDGDGSVALRIALEAEAGLAVDLELPDGTKPMRLNACVALPAAAELPADRLAEVVEDVVLGRSSLIDARPTEDGAGAEIVVVVYPDGVTRHNVLAALFEIQKVRLLLIREVDAAVAAERTVASLEALASEAWAAQPDPEEPEGRSRRRRHRSV